MKHTFKTTREPFARYYLDCDSDCVSLKVARGLYGAASEMNLHIDESTGLPDCSFNGMNVNFSFGGGISVYGDGLDYLAAETPELADDYEYIKNQMNPLRTGALIMNSFSENERALMKAMAIWGGTWLGHSVPNFADIAKYGTDSFREKVERYRGQNQGKDEFYDSVNVTLDAIDALGRRLREAAERQLEAASDETVRRKLRRAVKTFTDAPKLPCTDFYGACAVYVMLFTFDGIDSPGHFDQYMLDFYRNTDAETRYEVLCDIWQFFHNSRTWNLCIGGSDANGCDLTNELTYDILDVAMKYKYNTPNLTLRIHKGTPDKLFLKAADSIATGIGMPALYNDEVVCAAYEKLGMPPSDAHEYVMNGCNQIDIQGKSHMGLEDGEVNFGKALEYTLWNGVDKMSNQKLSISTGDPCGFMSFDEFLAAFFRQLDFLSDTACEMANKSQRVVAEHCPMPLRCLTTIGCIERGIEFKSGGPLYGHGQILTEGMADTFDSLAAVKKYVYDEKRLDMPTLLAALDADYDGYPEVYKLLCDNPDRFGNDIEWVDELAGYVTDHFMRHLLTLRTYRGGVYGGGCSPFNRAANNGRHTAALPNGRRKGDPYFADSIGAVPGADTHGPTALLKSVLHYDQTEVTSGFVLNLKFDKALFATDKGKSGFVGLVKTYFAYGGQQVQVNVLDKDELIDAQLNPDAHRDLIVRVGGYSDYFNNLTRDLQNNVIARTGHKL